VFNLEPLGKILIMTGSLIVIAGILMVFWNRVPFLGKLPGDIFIQRGSSQFFFPTVSYLLESRLDYGY
jgi:hypothetical protein